MRRIMPDNAASAEFEDYDPLESSLESQSLVKPSQTIRKSNLSTLKRMSYNYLISNLVKAGQT